MPTTLTQRCQSILTGAAATIGLTVVSTPAIAADFTFQDSSAIALSFENVSVLPEGNTRSLLNIQAINISDRTVEDAGHIVPFVWTLFDDNVVTLDWKNRLGGWFTEDYDGLGHSLLITSSLPERVRLGDIADLTGNGSLPRTQPCTNNPSCVLLPPVPTVRQQAGDKIPFLRLGRLAPGESVTFDESFTFAFEDNRAGTLSVLPTLYTVEAIPAAVPEPASAMALVAIGGLATVIQRKRTDRHS